MPYAYFLFALLQTLPLPGAAKHLAVFASTSAPAAAPSTKVSLNLDLTPNPGIHVYAPGAKDYMPISLKLDPPRGVTASPLRYPKSQTMTFEGQKIPVYDKPFRLVQVVTLDSSLKSGDTITVTGTLNYQACNEEVCFIPASVPVRWTIDVAK